MRLYKISRWVAGALAAVLIVGPLGNYFYDTYKQTNPPILVLIVEHWPYILTLFALLVGLSLRSWMAEKSERRKQKRALLLREFLMLKSASELRPEDFDFQPIEHNERPIWASVLTMRFTFPARRSRTGRKALRIHPKHSRRLTWFS